MAQRAFKKVVSDNADLQRVQENVQAALEPVISSPIVDGLLISAQLESGSNKVAHKLGRKPQGYIVVTKSANIDVWGSVMSPSILTLEASGNVTLTLWIF